MLSKIEAGKLELDPRECDLASITYDIVEIMSHAAQQKGLPLNCRLALEACVVGLCDDNRLRQVLVNLLGNAIKFTSSGSITLTVDRVAERDQIVRLRFVISDTGVGIPAERLDRVLKVFSQVDSSTTRQFGGSGLGLSICKQLVEIMGGKIGVESEVGVGTTFWFESELVTTEGTSAARHLLARTRTMAVDGLDRQRRQHAAASRSRTPAPPTRQLIHSATPLVFRGRSVTCVIRPAPPVPSSQTVGCALSGTASTAQLPANCNIECREPPSLARG